MVKKSVFHLFRLIFVLSLILSQTVSLAQSQPPIPEYPRHRKEVGTSFDRLPPAPTLHAALAAQSPNDQRIPWSKVVFESYRDNNYEIYIANDDGSGLARLTSDSRLRYPASLESGRDPDRLYFQAPRQL